jgi:glycosyltransferase involved in cell wall biosynthesis
MSKGISIILCSHNGESRLPPTLSHLRTQAGCTEPWEVLLIDNASTDDTAKIALSCWSTAPTPLRIVHEPKLGLQFARERGLKEAKYDFLAFVDDDNWVASNWVMTAYSALAGDPLLGAVGSICDPVCEIPEPDWFSQYNAIYAILTDADLTEWSQPDYLNGAGLCVRKEAWEQLVRAGFRSLVTDRLGARLSGGGDTELTMALRLAGWKIRVEPNLRLRHFMPASRLRWDYLRRLERGYAASYVSLEAYSAHNLSMRLGFKPRLGQRWWCQLGRCVLRLMRRPSAVLAAATSNGENRQEVLEVERLYGRMLGMLRVRSGYRAARRHVRYAPWRLRQPNEYLRQLRRANH